VLMQSLGQRLLGKRQGHAELGVDGGWRGHVGSIRIDRFLTVIVTGQETVYL
jgi:hypothetical protein